MASAAPETLALAAIPRLLARLRGSSRVGRASAIKALCTLAISPEYCAVVRDTVGIMQLLVAQLRDSSSVIQEAAAELLGLMISEGSTESKAAALKAGAMPQLVALLKRSGGSSSSGSRASSSSSNAGSSGSSNRSSPESVQLQALLAIRELIRCSEAGRAALQAADGIEALVWLLGTASASPELLVEVTGLLIELPVGSEQRTAAATAAGACDVLAPLLSHPNRTVQHQAAWACRNLAWGTRANRVAAVDAGCVPPLLRLLHRSGPVQVQAAAALSNMAQGGHPCAQALLDAGAAQILVDLLRSTSEAGSADAGSSSSSSSSSREQDDVACSLAGALAIMISAGGPAAVEAAVGAAGGMQQLRELLLTHGDAEAHNLAAEALGPQPEPDGPHSFAVTTGGAATGGGEEQPTAAEPEKGATAAAACHPAPKVCAAQGCGTTRGLKRCGGCASLRYCSVACSRAHWRAHKAECRRLQAAAPAASAATGTLQEG